MRGEEPPGGFSNLLAKGRCKLLAQNKNLLGHALPPTIGIVRSRRDLANPPPESCTRQVFTKLDSSIWLQNHPVTRWRPENAARVT